MDRPAAGGEQEMKTIDLGGVNCYLLDADGGFVLVDTGFAGKRSQLIADLESAGCKPGNLKLILLTHGDIDHVANAACLREKYGAKIAMHAEDAGMVEEGNMEKGRKPRPDRISLIGLAIILIGQVSSLFHMSLRFEKFHPDLFVEDDQDLAEFGLDARVVHLPGHSRGSIGVLTRGGELICGDLLWNMRKPGLHFLVDDLKAHSASLRRLRALSVKTIYPGHGCPFRLEELPL
jgi:glyoxylase-like metal-dependent hydrolase (beta-lactamase superfamily II)